MVERGGCRMIAASEALERLRTGNGRFVAGENRTHERVSHMRRAELISGQAPFAIVLGCSDSRVPAELVFDQGLGDLFVIRVAGNVVAESQIGSVEFAAEQFGVPLVVVLGHSSCGAVQATLDDIARDAEQQSPNLRSIVSRVRPAVEPLLAKAGADDPVALLREAVRANVRHSVVQLSHGSRILEGLIAAGELHVVGAEYCLETGRVDFFTEVDPGAD